jgi:RNA polymerase sigma-70 factor (sigma-E family)
MRAEFAADVRAVVPLPTVEAKIETFEDVYRREALAMVQLAFLLVGSPQRAEEIVQDAFAALFQRWDRVDRPGAYLRASVVNRCRSAHRRRALERRSLATQEGPTAVGLGTDDLADALAALPPKRRAAIVLRYYGGHSEAEIATLLGVRPGTVKSLLHRGLAQLREVIER